LPEGDRLVIESIGEFTGEFIGVIQQQAAVEILAVSGLSIFLVFRRSQPWFKRFRRRFDRPPLGSPP
jgi:hypothetical protein